MRKENKFCKIGSCLVEKGKIQDFPPGEKKEKTGCIATRFIL